MGARETIVAEARSTVDLLQPQIVLRPLILFCFIIMWLLAAGKAGVQRGGGSIKGHGAAWC